MDTISQLTSEMSAGLALDLAADLWPEGQVFKNHNIDPVYGAALLQKDWFRAMVDEAKREWGSINNAKQRIKLKSQIAVEMSINNLYQIVTDHNTPATARVAAFKEVKDVSGTAAPDPNLGGPAAPMVNIFLGGSDEPAMSIMSGGRSHDADSPDVIDVYPEEVTPGNLDFGLAPL